MKRFYKILKHFTLFTLTAAVALFIVIWVITGQPQFGQLPEGERLSMMKKSPRFHDGHFHNRVEKPTISEGYSYTGEIFKFLFNRYPRLAPKDSLPSIKTNLKSLPIDHDVIVWFGHSSVFIQADGVKFLVDPIFSGKASPLPWGPKAYKGTDIYSADDMPEIDYLLISHNHYDHLDYETVLALKKK